MAPDPSTNKQNVADLAEKSKQVLAAFKDEANRELHHLAHTTKEGVLNAADDFQRQTPYFKARIAVVVGFLVVVLGSWAIARVPGATNEIEAMVLASSVWQGGVHNTTIVQVGNRSGSGYHDLEIEIRGTAPDGSGERRWWYSTPALGNGQTVELEPHDLKDRSGGSPEIEYLPNQVTIRCREGVYIAEVTLTRAAL